MSMPHIKQTTHSNKENRQLLKTKLRGPPLSNILEYLSIKTVFNCMQVIRIDSVYHTTTVQTCIQLLLFNAK